MSKKQTKIHLNYDTLHQTKVIQWLTFMSLFHVVTKKINTPTSSKIYKEIVYMHPLVIMIINEKNVMYNIFLFF